MLGLEHAKLALAGLLCLPNAPVLTTEATDPSTESRSSHGGGNLVTSARPATHFPEVAAKQGWRVLAT